MGKIRLTEGEVEEAWREAEAALEKARSMPGGEVQVGQYPCRWLQQPQHQS